MCIALYFQSKLLSLRCWLAVILFSLFSYNICNSQSARTQSLSADSLLLQAQNAYKKNYRIAKEIALQAKTNSIQHDNKAGVVKATCLLGLIAVNTNEEVQFQNLYTLLKETDKKDSSNQSLINITLSKCWYELGDYDSSRKYIERAEQFYNKQNKTTSYAEVCLQTAKVYNKLGANDKALAKYYDAITVLKYHNDEQLNAWGGNILGQLYYNQKLYQKAIDNFNSSYKTFLKIRDANGVVSSLLLMGNVYYKQIKDDSATICYNASLQAASNLGDSIAMAINYSNLSRLYLEHQKPAKAIELAQKALATISSSRYVTIEAGTLQQLGDIYGELGQFPNAISYVKKALLLARQADNKIIVLDCYKSLSELYMANQQPAAAFDNLLAAYRIKDSVQPVAFNRQLAQMQIQYETKQKEDEITLLKQGELISKLKLKEQQAQINKQRITVVLLIILLIAVAIAAYYYLKGRRAAEQLKQNEMMRKAAEEERQRIAKDIHDELGSGLSKIRFLSELTHKHEQGNPQLNTTLHSISDTSKHIIENMKDLVWAMNPDNSTMDSLLARIREYSSEYLEEMPIELVIDIPEDVPHIPITKEFNRNVFMILKEALQNMVKHAEATRVIIHISIATGFRMEISDNGKGVNILLIKEGNGLKNMEARSRAIGVVFSRVSTPSKGTKIILEQKG